VRGAVARGLAWRLPERGGGGRITRERAGGRRVVVRGCSASCSVPRGAVAGPTHSYRCGARRGGALGDVSSRTSPPVSQWHGEGEQDGELDDLGNRAIDVASGAPDPVVGQRSD